ncbi:MAG: hypothetical protein K6A70_01325, partial [Erysipelotrichaceae bacterium]|nr:hypothetical protein [Erysipelotrichaceae bacterium]
MKKKIHQHIKKPLILLSILIVFVTVYSLVLPALTLDEQTAEDAPDIVLNSETKEVPAEQNEEEAQKVDASTEEVTGNVDNDPADTDTEVLTSDDQNTLEAGKSTDQSSDMIQNDQQTENSSDLLIDDSINNEQSVDEQPVEETEVKYPESKFSQTVNDSIIFVEAPEGALPEGTQLEAEEVEDTAKIEESINNELNNSIVKNIKAIDIRFIYNDEEIEPKLPIKVSITSAFVENNDNEALLMHIDDEGKSDVVEQNVINE